MADDESPKRLISIQLEAPRAPRLHQELSPALNHTRPYRPASAIECASSKLIVEDETNHVFFLADLSIWQ